MFRLHVLSLIVAIAMLVVPGTMRADPGPLTSPDGVRTQILEIPEPQPVRASETLFRGLLYTPEAGTNPNSPGIIIIHGGLAGHPARQTDAARFAAARLAAKGYTVFSPMTRHSRDEYSTQFEDIEIDIRTSIAALEARGIREIILAGHGLGSARISYYQATQQDARVKALIHFSPVDDIAGPDGAARRRIKDYDQKLAEAEAAIAAGGSNTNLSGSATAEELANVRGIINAVSGYLYTAESFVSHWGPDTKARNPILWQEIDDPMLMLVGSEDETTPDNWKQGLQSLAEQRSQIETLSYDGVNAAFEGTWDATTEDIADWLDAIGLAPRPRIEVELLDARMGDGAYLPGILYTPEDGPDPAKPAFVLQHGWTGNTMYSSNHWLAKRLAEAGYVALAPQTRVSGPPQSRRASLAEYVEDIGAWMDVMDARGFDRVIAEGHSMGGLWLSNYMSVTDDPRVIGMVYLAPTRDVSEYLRGGLGAERYDALYEKMWPAVQAGQGMDVYHYEKFRVPNVDQKTGPVSRTLIFAKTFVEYHGPDTRAVHTARVAEFSRPSLSIAGRQDLLMTDTFIDQFLASHQGDAQVIWYENGSHGLRESKDRVAADVLDWTQQTFGE